jgi:hypothetical protein
VALANGVEVADVILTCDMKGMSFIVRGGTAGDGENHWVELREFQADILKTFGPALPGTPETIGFRHGFPAGELTVCAVFVAGRDDGREKGEMMAVYWKKDRFEKTDGGHFWFSETPEKAGSKSWDSSLPRMAT